MRETWVTSSAPAEIDQDGFCFHVHLEPHGEWHTGLDVLTAVDGTDGAKTKPKYKDVHDTPTPNVGMSLQSWIARAPQLHSSWTDFERIYERSLVDLAALRFFSSYTPGEALPAAGLPWFMALFGRDSLFTSFQVLPLLYRILPRSPYECSPCARVRGVMISAMKSRGKYCMSREGVR